MPHPLSPHSTLPQAIAEELRRRIRSGELRPGERLPGHRELAAVFSVSLGSVREAISMLVSAGLIETRAARGTFVADPPRPDGLPRAEQREIHELLKAREFVESQIAAMAAERAGPDDVVRLRACVERLRQAADDPGGFPEADLEFHLALGEAAGNRFLLAWLQDVRALLRRDMELAAEAAIRRFGSLDFSVEAHAALVDAVEAGRVADAQAVVLGTMAKTHEFVLGLYALAPPSRSAAREAAPPSAMADRIASGS
ncbi:MAG TPA: FadR/GntR family transcriptional regulator [Gaiellaceae bacterium]|nr:FadR/GntR family transcriptional regulator [Gaiellaceae bacterium]